MHLDGELGSTQPGRGCVACGDGAQRRRVYARHRHESDRSPHVPQDGSSRRRHETDRGVTRSRDLTEGKMIVKNSRREFFGLAAGALASVSVFPKRVIGGSIADKPALLGGTPVHTGRWPQWPEWRQTW